MNLKEALISAREGNFVTSTRFDSNESLHYYKGKYYYEDGAVVTEEFLFNADWTVQHPWEIRIPKEKVDFDKLKKMHDESKGYMLQERSYMDCII